MAIEEREDEGATRRLIHAAQARGWEHGMLRGMDRHYPRLGSNGTARLEAAKRVYDNERFAAEEDAGLAEAPPPVDLAERCEYAEAWVCGFEVGSHILALVQQMERRLRELEQLHIRHFHAS